MFKRNGIDMNFFKSLFKYNTPKPETQSFQASNLQTAISKILVRTAKIDDEFHKNPRKIDGFIKSLCPQYQEGQPQNVAQPSSGIIGGALKMLNPSNNGIFSAVKHIGNKLTSPLQKIISDGSSTADTNPIGQQLQNIVQPQQTQVIKEQTQDIIIL